MISEATKALFAAHADKWGFKSECARFVKAKAQSVGEWADGTTPPSPRYWTSLEEFFGVEAGYFADLAIQDLAAEHGINLKSAAVLRRRVRELEAEKRALEAQLAAALDKTR